MREGASDASESIFTKQKVSSLSIPGIEFLPGQATTGRKSNVRFYLPILCFS
jgi:hypothetical protein